MTSTTPNNPDPPIQGSDDIERLVDTICARDLSTNKLEITEALQRIALEARNDELLRACRYWEKNPNLPATYLIDRRAELTKLNGGTRDENRTIKA